MALVTFTSYTESERMKEAFILELRAKLISLNALTTKFEMTGKRVGDSIVVGKYKGGATATRVPGAAGVGTGTVVGKSLTLPNPTYVQWGIPSGVGGPQDFYRIGMDQMKILAAGILAVPFAEVTKANFGDTAADKLVKSADAFGRTAVGALGKLAAEKGLNDPGMVLNSSYYWNLLTDYSGGMLDKDSFVAGTLPNQAGMIAYQYPGLDDNDENLQGIVADKTAILVGLAPLIPEAKAGDGDLIEFEIVQDADSQVAMCFSRWFKSDESVMYGRAEVMAVAAVGNEKGIVRIVSK
jgi:hypothetical protein